MPMTTKKILASLIFGVMLVISAGTPQKAEAFLGFGDIVLDPANLVETIINVYQEGEGIYKEFVLDPLAWVVGKQAAQSVVKSVISWAGNGFDGEPSFVTDLNSNMLRVGDTVAEDFLKQYLENNSVNSPYRDTIANSIRSDYYRSTGPGAFFNSNEYDLDQYSEDPEAFTSGDFTKGGWTAWWAINANPQNNPRGAYITAQGALDSTVQNAQDNRSAELDWGSGFLAYRGNCNTGHSGVSASGSTQNSGNGGVTVTSGSGDTTQDGVTVTGNTGGGTQNGVTVTDGSQISLSGTFDCLLTNTIQTQGATIKASIDKALGSGIDQLVSADEFNEIVGSLFSSLISSVMDEGLSNVSKPSSNGRSTLGDATDANQLTGGSLGSSFAKTIDNQKKQVEGYKENWETINKAALEAKAACGSRNTDADAIIQQSTQEIARAVEALAELDKLKAKTSSTSSTDLTNLAEEFDALQKSGTLPSPEEIAEARINAMDNSGGDSMVSQMKEAKKSCLIRGF
jgi:hypothetical protein